jgi:hypothetical protein
MSHFIRITAHWNLGPGNNAVNTFHFSADGVGTFTGLDRVAESNRIIGHLKTMYNSWATGGLAGAWTIGDVVTEHDGTNPPTYIAATPQTSTVVAGSLAAYQLACVVSWRTALAGRSYRGRTYVGPLKTSAFAFPDLASTTATQLASAANTMISNVNSVTGLVCCVWAPSANRDPITHVPAGQTTKIVSALSSVACRTMRSRAS